MGRSYSPVHGNVWALQHPQESLDLFDGRVRALRADLSGTGEG
ncbi:hypothetical protein [Coralloluteibacterium stylophorae]|nr:hypothetical protein [Coralloluteibacterium stylophorae]